MRFVKISSLRLIGFALFLCLSHVSSSGQSVNSSSGESVKINVVPSSASIEGLQMSISRAASDKAGFPEFEIAFKNSGEEGIALNLGAMLANGRVKLPENISLTIVDARGQTRRLRFADKRYLFVAGRVDDYLAPIRKGSIYTLKVSLDQFWSPATKESEVKLAPGKYRITAEFEGGISKASWYLDPDRIDVIDVQRGQLRSNTLEIER
jgi:hypothetical protein